MVVCMFCFFFFFFKQKTAYEMRISDWSSDVCSSDLAIADILDLEADRHRAARGERVGHGQFGHLEVGFAVDDRESGGADIALEQLERMFGEAVEQADVAALPLDVGGNRGPPRRIVDHLDMIFISEDRSLGQEGFSTCKSEW